MERSREMSFGVGEVYTNYVCEPSLDLSLRGHRVKIK